MALLLGGGCLVTRFPILLGSAVKVATSRPGGPFLELTVDTCAHSPRGTDRSSLIPAARAHTVAPHSPPHSSRAGSVCSSEETDLGPGSPPDSYLFSILDESLCLSRPVRVPTCTPGMMPAWTSTSLEVGQDLENVGVCVSGRQCLQPLCILLITLLISVPLLIPPHSLYYIHCAPVYVCVECSLQKVKRKLPPHGEG